MPASGTGRVSKVCTSVAVTVMTQFHSHPEAALCQFLISRPVEQQNMERRRLFANETPTNRLHKAATVSNLIPYHSRDALQTTGW